MAPLKFRGKQETLRFSEVGCNPTEITLASVDEQPGVLRIAVDSGPKQSFSIRNLEDGVERTIPTPLIPAGEAYDWQPIRNSVYTIKSDTYPHLGCTVTVGPSASTTPNSRKQSLDGAIDDCVHVPLSRPKLLGVSRPTPSPEPANSTSSKGAMFHLTSGPAAASGNSPSFFRPRSSTNHAEDDDIELEELHPSLPGLRQRRRAGATTRDPNSVPTPSAAQPHRVLAGLKAWSRCQTPHKEEDSLQPCSPSENRSYTAGRFNGTGNNNATYGAGSGDSDSSDSGLVKLLDVSRQSNGSSPTNPLLGRNRNRMNRGVGTGDDSPSLGSRHAPKHVIHRCPRCNGEFLCLPNQQRCLASHVKRGKGARLPAVASVEQLSALWDGMAVDERKEIFDFSKEPEATRALHQLAAAPRQTGSSDALDAAKAYKLHQVGVYLATVAKDPERVASLSGSRLVGYLNIALEETLLYGGSSGSGGTAATSDTSAAISSFLVCASTLGCALETHLVAVYKAQQEKKAKEAYAELEAALVAEETEKKNAAPAVPASAGKKKSKKKKGGAKNKGEVAAATAAAAVAVDVRVVADSCMEEIVIVEPAEEVELENASVTVPAEEVEVEPEVAVEPVGILVEDSAEHLTEAITPAAMENVSADIPADVEDIRDTEPADAIKVDATISEMPADAMAHLPVAAPSTAPPPAPADAETAAAKAAAESDFIIEFSDEEAAPVAVPGNNNKGGRAAARVPSSRKPGPAAGPAAVPSREAQESRGGPSTHADPVGVSASQPRKKPSKGARKKKKMQAEAEAAEAAAMAPPAPAPAPVSAAPIVTVAPGQRPAMPLPVPKRQQKRQQRDVQPAPQQNQSSPTVSRAPSPAVAAVPPPMALPDFTSPQVSTQIQQQEQKHSKQNQNTKPSPGAAATAVPAAVPAVPPQPPHPNVAAYAPLPPAGLPPYYFPYPPMMGGPGAEQPMAVPHHHFLPSQGIPHHPFAGYGYGYTPMGIPMPMGHGHNGLPPPPLHAMPAMPPPPPYVIAHPGVMTPPGPMMHPIHDSRIAGGSVVVPMAVPVPLPAEVVVPELPPAPPAAVPPPRSEVGPVQQQEQQSGDSINANEKAEKLVEENRFLSMVRAAQKRSAGAKSGAQGQSEGTATPKTPSEAGRATPSAATAAAAPRAFDEAAARTFLEGRCKEVRESDTPKEIQHSEQPPQQQAQHVAVEKPLQTPSLPVTLPPWGLRNNNHNNNNNQGTTQHAAAEEILPRVDSDASGSVHSGASSVPDEGGRRRGRGNNRQSRDGQGIRQGQGLRRSRQGPHSSAPDEAPQAPQARNPQQQQQQQQQQEQPKRDGKEPPRRGIDNRRRGGGGGGGGSRGRGHGSSGGNTPKGNGIAKGHAGPAAVHPEWKIQACA